MSEERKLVTILFADIVGSTAAGFEHDPEIVRDALARTFAAARGVLESHGGTVEKFIGDAVMAVFGVPAAHDDDADRAVRAAFALRDRVAAVASEPLAFELRIGVNTGEAVAGSARDGHFLVTGSVVNIAARIQQAAAPGEILVGPLTYHLTAESVEYGDPREIGAKGAGAVVVRTPISLRTATPEQHRGVAGLRAPLIGRDRELGLLHSALERCASERSPALVTIYASAGAGKSRLVHEFAATVPAGRLLIGRCLPYGDGVTFYALQTVLRSDMGIDPADDRSSADAKLERAVAAAFASAPDDSVAVTQRLRVAAGLAGAAIALPDVSESDVPEEIHWGVRRYLERRADDAPLVIVLEDLHWAEPAMLHLIERLGESARGPLLLICLARLELRETRPTFGAGVANSAAVTLAPLSASDTDRLIRELLPAGGLPADARAEIVARAEGNPLYVEEYLRLALESGGPARLELPPTLRGLITARLDRVAAPVKRLLQHASVAGRLFSTSALEAIGGAAPEPEVLREAVRRDLLVEADERAPGAGRVYRFRHALFREVAYSTVPKSDRARMHGSYLRWLGSTLGERAEEIVEILAFHAEQAFRYAHELGWSEATDLGARALDLLVSAADRARRRNDLAALRLYDSAASVGEAIATDDAKRVHARGYALLTRLWTTADPHADLEAELDRLLELAQATGPSEVLVDLLDRKALEAHHAGDNAASRLLFDRLPEVARDTGRPEVMVHALIRAAIGAYELRDLQTERERLELAVLEARRGASGRLPDALLRLANVMANRECDFTTAQRLREEALAVAPADLSPYQRFFHAHIASNFAWLVGDVDEAVVEGTEALEGAREAAIPWPTAFACWRLGQAVFAAGDADHARALFEEGAVIMDRLKAKVQIPELHARAALACLRLGDVAAAERHVGVARDHLLPNDVDSFYITAVAEAELAAATGSAERATSIYGDAVAELAQTGFRMDTALARLAYGEHLLRRGRPDEAKPMLAAARTAFEDPLAFRRRARIDALIATCDTPRSAPDLTRPLYRAASGDGA